MTDLFAKKPLGLLMEEARETGTHSLKRTLGVFQLTALGVGAVIGAGIFVLSGLGAHYAGPGLMLSFVLSGLGCTFAALCYAEFAAMIPLAGSAYTYAYATLGEIVAWIIGWDLILEYSLGATTVAIGWSGYVVSFLRDLGIALPHGYVTSPFGFEPVQGVWYATGSFLNVPAMVVVFLMSAVLLIGIRESARLNTV